VSPLFRRGGLDPRELPPGGRAPARAERAARRAERRGEPPPDLFDVESTPPPMPPEAEVSDRAAEPEPPPDEPASGAVSPPTPGPAPPRPEPGPTPPPTPDPGPPPTPDPGPPPTPQPTPPPPPDPTPPPQMAPGAPVEDEEDAPARQGVRSFFATPKPGAAKKDLTPPGGDVAKKDLTPPVGAPPAGSWPADPADAPGEQDSESDHWPADPADVGAAGAPGPWPTAEGGGPGGARPRPQPHAQATAEIPLEELPDGGASLLAGDEEESEPEFQEPPPGPGPTQSPARGRGRPWLLRIAALVALLLVAAAIWFIVSLFQPFKGGASPHRATLFIPKGADAGRIGDILERRGVISSSFFFDLRARLAGKRGDLKPGVYSLHKDSSYGDVLTALAKGPPPARKVAITVPEGRSRREEAARIRTNSNLQGSYLAATKSSPVLKPSRYGAPPGTASLEGFLFPATYELRSDAPVTQLVTQQLEAFKRAIRRVPMRIARSKNLSTYDVLIIASMVEREAMLRRERPIIAGVIYNRLRRNIPLGIDATIRYATGNWLRPLTQSQLRIKSAYNTRIHQGLPPTPIGSPGIAAIRAAAHPKRTPYLYYVVKPGACGEHAFARTFAQFQRETARYNSARARAGGRSPTKCP
jgi:UPF0755 protein